MEVGVLGALQHAGGVEKIVAGLAGCALSCRRADLARRGTGQALVAILVEEGSGALGDALPAKQDQGRRTLLALLG